jgi:two-component system, chemotaxis family, chemotaxis protein CheY
MRETCRVLVVDDDAEIRQIVKDVLEEAGCEVALAREGREALNILRAAGAPRPCLILLDLMMPVMDGYEFREEQLRDSALAEIPVVMFTASGTSVRLEGEVLRKPFRLDRLLTIVESKC